MKLQRLILVALLVTGLPLIQSPVAKAVPVEATGSPWQPIARIDAKKSYQVQLVNQTGLEVEYSSTTNEFPPRRITAGGKAAITKLPVPVYLLISSVDPGFGVKCIVSAKNNVVTVTVQPLPQGNPGTSTINIQETGGIYVY